jgi:hypothetical protein
MPPPGVDTSAKGDGPVQMARASTIEIHILRKISNVGAPLCCCTTLCKDQCAAWAAQSILMKEVENDMSTGSIVEEYRLVNLLIIGQHWSRILWFDEQDLQHDRA